MKTLENVMHKSWKKSQGQNRTERFNDVAKAIRSYYLSILPEKITIDNQDDYDDETNDEELYRFGWCAAIDEMKKRIGG